jgi:N-acetylmuramoyl-L-alanine amidase
MFLSWDFQKSQETAEATKPRPLPWIHRLGLAVLLLASPQLGIPAVAGGAVATGVAPSFRPIPRPIPRPAKDAGKSPHRASKTKHQQGPALAAPRFLVVLDPGHGGTDLGTVYANGKIRVEEKNITLKLALDTAQELRGAGVDVLLTREHDVELTLGERTQKANEAKADAFVSIHLNAPASDLASISKGQLGLPQPEGVETYILDTATDESSHRLARLENSVLSGSEAKQKSSQAPPEVALILKEAQLDATAPRSFELACRIQTHLSQERGPKSDRGVRKALFHVLLGADMPSALVEAGFLSSPRDRSVLLLPKRRAKVARALAQALLEVRNADARAASAPWFPRGADGGGCLRR